MTDNPVYELTSLESSPERYLYLFRSNNDGLKLVVHQLIEIRENRKVFNLGFGHWDEERESLIDDEVYNGMDGRMVLNTVLATIPLFFRNCPNDSLLIQGSDSRDDFSEKCRISCTKNCKEECKKQHQRIRIYCNYLDKHFKELVKEYIFFGMIETGNPDFEQYVPGTFYTSVLIYKKK